MRKAGSEEARILSRKKTNEAKGRTKHGTNIPFAAKERKETDVRFPSSLMRTARYHYSDASHMRLIICQVRERS